MLEVLVLRCRTSVTLAALEVDTEAMGVFRVLFVVDVSLESSKMTCFGLFN